MGDSVPPGFTPEEWAALPHDSIAPRFLVTIWVLSAVAGIFLAIRIYCKWIGKRGYWWDDYILIASWIALLVNCAISTYNVGLGLGRHSWDFDLANLDNFVLASNCRVVFTICATAWSKTSFAITLFKITDKSSWMRWALWFIIISMNILLGLSALWPFVQCTPIQKGWKPLIDGTCWGTEILVAYHRAAAAYSAAMDFVLAILPWRIILSLNMNIREKIGVAVALSMGAFAGAVAIVKTVQLSKLDTPDLQDSVILIIWDNAESAATIMAASIPVMRVLVRELRSSGRRYYENYGRHQSYAPNGPDARSRADGTGHPRSGYVATVMGNKSTGRASTEQLDDRSDRSILDSSKVFVTSELVVEEHRAQVEEGYEMGDMRKGDAAASSRPSK